MQAHAKTEPPKGTDTRRKNTPDRGGVQVDSSAGGSVGLGQVRSGLGQARPRWARALPPLWGVSAVVRALELWLSSWWLLA